MNPNEDVIVGSVFQVTNTYYRPTMCQALGLTNEQNRDVICGSSWTVGSNGDSKTLLD